MPFTFSHPAAVLPFRFLPKKYVSMTALVVGSMTPDFEYFIHFKQLTIYSHTWWGMLYYDLPLGLLLIFIFNHFVREIFINNLPGFLNTRFSRYRHSEGNYLVQKPWYIMAGSLLAGIFTHLVWDKVTHHSVQLFDEGWDFYGEIWNFNSLIGIALLVFAIFRMPKRKNTQARQIWPYWKSILKYTLVTFLLVAIVSRLCFNAEVNWRAAGVSFISSFLIALLFTTYLTFKANKPGKAGE